MAEPLLTIKELSEHLSISTSTLRIWVNSREIPKSAYIKVGNTYRFSYSKVVKALEASREKDPVAPPLPLPDFPTARASESIEDPHDEEDI